MTRRSNKQAAIKDLPDAMRLLGERLSVQANRPNIIRYKPHSKQQAFHSAQTRGRLFIGGNRSGKTTSGVTEDIMWCMGQHPYRPHRYNEPIRGRVVGVDFPNGISKIILPEVARWVPPSQLLGGTWSSAYDQLQRTLHFENGSFIEFMSYDQDLDKFAGTSRHFIHYDEEPPKDIFIECSTRLIDTQGDWWMTMTPVEGMTWIYDDVYLAGKTRPESSIKVVEVEMGENPHLAQAEIEQFASSLSEEEKLIRLQGKFVQRGGLIYKMFDPELHIIDPMVPDKNNLWLVGHDHGFNNPTAMLWASVDNNGRIIIFSEHYESGKTVDYHAAVYNERTANFNRPPELVISDPSIRNTDPITGTSILQEYSKYGVFCTLANNDVEAGLVRVARYLNTMGPDEKPMLLITRNCVNLINELLRYRWSSYRSKSAQHAHNVRETPHKFFDHAVDALRYIIMSRPDLINLPLDGPVGVNYDKPFVPTVASNYASGVEGPIPVDRLGAPIGASNNGWKTDEHGGLEWE